MNRTYTRWASRTGRILDTIDIPEEYYDMYSTLLVEGTINGEEYYMQNGVPTLRPDMELSISRLSLSVPNEEFTSISGIPYGATVVIENSELGRITQIVNSTNYIYRPQISGKFTFTFSSFPYKDATFDITAYSLEL